MKILEKGQIPEEMVIVHTCTNCKTKFEFTRKETSYCSDPRDGDL